MKQGWEIKKLGEVATYVNGYAFKPDHWADDGVPIIRIQNLNNQDAVYNYCNMDIPKKFVVEYGDILISWSASLGVYEWLGERSYLNQHIFKVVFDKCNINKYFFKYAVSGKINEMLKNAHGATMKHIVKKDFDNTEIIYPSIAEQERIVGELDCLSGIIANKRAQLRELDTLAQSIFYTMFGDPITNDKGWQTKKLGDVALIVGGSTPSTREETNWNGDLNWVTPAELNGTLYYGETQRKITTEGARGLELLPVGTVLLSSRAPIGKLAITTVPMYCNQGFKNVVCGESINNIYVYYYLLATIENVKALGVGATFKEVSKRAVENYHILVPPIDLQKQFAEKIENIERQKELITKSIKETEDLFNSRMSYYFD